MIEAAGQSRIDRKRAVESVIDGNDGVAEFFL